jgi:hypothetical protein
MADSRSITFTTEQLELLNARLHAHADSIVNAARLDVAEDLRTAARLAEQMAALRTGICEIAGKTVDSMTRDQIRALLGKVS